MKLLAVLLLTACAAVPADTTPEYSNAELDAALRKAVEIMAVQDQKIDEQATQIRKLRLEMSVDMGCT